MQNTYTPKFTYVIPFRFRTDRIIPLRRVVDWLSGFQGIEIMIVEQDKNSKISGLNFRATHVFLQSEGPFNKSWAFNVALKRAKSNTLVFGDADFIMNPNHLIESLKMLESHDCVIPTDNLINLNHGESVGDMNAIFQIQRPGVKANLTDGISIFKKDSLYRIGAWNEDFFGIGFTNKFQDKKIKQLLKYKQMNFSGYHLFHQPDGFDMAMNQRNSQILDFFNDGDVNKLNQHINMSLPRMGLMNKMTL